MRAGSTDRERRGRRTLAKPREKMMLRASTAPKQALCLVYEGQQVPRFGVLDAATKAARVHGAGAIADDRMRIEPGHLGDEIARLHQRDTDVRSESRTASVRTARGPARSPRSDSVVSRMVRLPHILVFARFAL